MLDLPKLPKKMGTRSCEGVPGGNNAGEGRAATCYCPLQLISSLAVRVDVQPFTFLFLAYAQSDN